MHIKLVACGIGDCVDVIDRVMYVLCWPTLQEHQLLACMQTASMQLVPAELGAVYTVKIYPKS